MNGKHDQTHASLHVCTYVQRSTCIYKGVCIHRCTKHERVHIHSMYNAYVCVYQYLFFFYIRPLFAVFNIHTMYKMLYEFKIHYKKHIKRCIRSYSNRNSSSKCCMHTIKISMQKSYGHYTACVYELKCKER